MRGVFVLGVTASVMVMCSGDIDDTEQCRKGVQRLNEQKERANKANTLDTINKAEKADKKINCASSNRRSVLFDSEESAAERWQKQSIQYMLEHRDSLLRYAKGLLSKAKIDTREAEDIIQKTYDYFYNNSDYNIHTAITASEAKYNKEIISLEGYVKNTIGQFVKRHTSAVRTEAERRAKQQYSLDGKEVDSLEYIEDKEAYKEYDKLLLNIEEQLKAMEYKRYIANTDIYMTIYMYFMFGASIAEKVLRLHGVTKNQIRSFKDIMTSDSDVHTLVHLAANLKESGQMDKLENTLGKFVYDRVNLHRAGELFRSGQLAIKI